MVENLSQEIDDKACELAVIDSDMIQLSRAEERLRGNVREYMCR
jgi:hypothetical protein